MVQLAIGATGAPRRPGQRRARDQAVAQRDAPVGLHQRPRLGVDLRDLHALRADLGADAAARAVVERAVRRRARPGRGSARPGGRRTWARGRAASRRRPGSSVSQIVHLTQWSSESRIIAWTVDRSWALLEDRRCGRDGAGQADALARLLAPGLGAGHQRAGGVEVGPDRLAVRRRPAACASSTATPLRMSGWWSRWRGLRRGPPGAGPRTGSPATVSRRPPRESSSIAARREAAGGEHDGVGRQRPRPRRLAHPHAGHAAEAPSTPDRVRARAPAGPRPRASAAVSGPLQAHAGDARRHGRHLGDRRAEQLLEVVPRLAGPREPHHRRQQDGLPRLDPRPQLVGQASPLGRVVEPARVHRAGHVGAPGPGRPADLERRAPRRGPPAGRRGRGSRPPAPG